MSLEELSFESVNERTDARTDGQRTKSDHLSGRRYKFRSALRSADHQFLMGVLTENEHCFKYWVKRFKRCVLAKGEYFEDN